MNYKLSSRASVGVALAGLAALSACQESESISAPESLAPPTALAVGDAYYGDGSAMPGVVVVCAFYPDEADYGPSTFSVSATGGDTFSGDLVIDPVPDCFEVWNATSADSETITASLLDDPETLEVDRVVTIVGGGPTVTTYEGVTSVSEQVSSAVGAQIWFKFKKFESPPQGGQGCTPGYWRQPHHYDSWVGFSPDDLFHDVFGGDDYPGLTLGEAVALRGGQLNALARSAVAAILNASSPGVDYDYTVAEIVSLYDEAIAGTRRDVENLKDRLDFLNNQGCELN